METEHMIRMAIADYFGNITRGLYKDGSSLEKEILRVDTEFRTELRENVIHGRIGVAESATTYAAFERSLSELSDLPKRIKEVERTWTQSGSYLRAHFDRFTTVIAIPENFDLSNMNAAIDDIVSYAVKRDNVVNLLITKAESDGLEAAIADGAIKYAVTEIFPTENIYVQYFVELGAAAVVMTEEAVKIVGIDRGDPVTYKALGTAMKKIVDVLMESSVNADVLELYAN